jgi:hypothetical protein
MSDALVMTRREAAAALRISERHLDNTLREIGGVVRIGRSVRVPLELVERIARGGVPGGSAAARAAERAR